MVEPNHDQFSEGTRSIGDCTIACFHLSQKQNVAVLGFAIDFRSANLNFLRSNLFLQGDAMEAEAQRYTYYYRYMTLY
jgi:hypothetical protein